MTEFGSNIIEERGIRPYDMAVFNIIDPGPTSFTFLQTANSDLYATYRESCQCYTCSRMTFLALVHPLMQ